MPLARRAESLGVALLAGGQASRYGGRRKGLLEIAPGLSLLQHLIGQLRLCGLGEIVLLANDSDPYHALGLPILPDLRFGCGPLAGMEAGLHHYLGRYAATLFLPCDLPGLTALEITRLAEAFLEGEAGVATCATEASVQPLCAVVDQRLLSAIQEALDAGERSPRRLWRQLGAEEVPFADPAPFFNLNCPADLAEWIARRDHRGLPQCAPEPA